MAVSAKSVLTHNDVKIKFLIEDDTFPEYLPEEVECQNVSDQKFFPGNGANYHTNWTYMAMMRLALPKIIDADRALWLDVDTITLGDITPLLETDLGEFTVAAVKEPVRCIEPFIYCNTGVTLMDLKRIDADELIRYVNRVPLRCPDQDTINVVMQSKILPVSPKWNACRFTEMPANRVIEHYAGRHDWHNERYYIQYQSREWRQKT